MSAAYQQRMDRALRRLRHSTLVGEAGFEGCSDEQIAAIERRYDVRLPASYRRFLSELGVSMGGFLPGDDLCYPAVLELTDEVRAWLDERDGRATVSATEFVFAGHHDYVYLSFDTAAGSDPPVDRYVAGDTRATRVFDTFSEWFEATVRDECSLAGP